MKESSVECEQLVYLLISFLNRFKNSFEEASIATLLNFYMEHKNTNYLYTICNFISYEPTLFDTTVIQFAKTICYLTKEHDTKNTLSHDNLYSYMESFITDYKNELDIHIDNMDTISILFGEDIYIKNIPYICLSYNFQGHPITNLIRNIYINHLKANVC